MSSTPVPGATPGPARAGVIFVLVTIALDMLALGIIIPVFPKLIESFVGGNTAHAASLLGLFSAAWALMQLIFAPIQGALSDRFGRRPVILLSNLGLGLDYILMALAPNLAWLFVGRLISGITAASFSTATAYIADVTAPEKRAQAFGWIGAAFGIGFILGPAIGGLLGSADPRLPFWVAAGFSLANSAYGYFILPESLPKDRRAPFRLVAANPIGSIRFLARSRRLMLLAGVGFLHNLAHAVLPAIYVLYAGHRYGWGEREVGLGLAAVGVCSAAVQGGLIKPIVSRLGEQSTLLLGLAFGTFAFLIYGLAPNGTVFLMGIPVMAIWGVTNPALQGLMTRLVEPTEQGQLQGAGQSLMAIANLAGPVIFTQIFALGIANSAGVQVPGAAYFLAAVLLAAAGLLAHAVFRNGGDLEPPE